MEFATNAKKKMHLKKSKYNVGRQDNMKYILNETEYETMLENESKARLFDHAKNSAMEWAKDNCAIKKQLKAGQTSDIYCDSDCPFIYTRCNEDFDDIKCLAGMRKSCHK